MTPKERAKVLSQQLHKAALRSRTALIEAAIRDAENDIMARISERLESEPDPAEPCQRSGHCARADAYLGRNDSKVSCLNHATI
jgi:hypothetical protein